MSGETEAIDALVRAYNAGDAVAFARGFTLEARTYEHPGSLAQDGRAAIEAFYAERFRALPGLRTRVCARVDLGRRIVDHERVDRGDGSPPFEVVAIYVLEGGLVTRLDLVRADHRT